MSPRTPWSGVAQAYDRSFGRLCHGAAGPLLDAVGKQLPDFDPASAPRLLDIGCGTGLLAIAAAGRGFAVTPADADADMTALAAARLGGHAVAVSSALPRLPFPDGTFDATVANFVVNHVPDPRAALRELARVTACARPVALTVWPRSGSRSAALFAEVIRLSGATAGISRSLPPELDFERHAVGLCGLMTEAHLTQATADEVDIPWRIDPEDLWLGVTAGIAGIGAVWSAQSHATRLRMRAAYDEVATAYLDDGLLSLPSRAVLCSALAPA